MAAKWFKLDWSQRKVLFEAAGKLIIAHLAIHILPFRWISPRLGKLEMDSREKTIIQEQQKEVRQVGWAVKVCARYFPWDAKCLAQAVTGKWMLQRRGIPSTLYMGVERVDEGDKWLEAHAWLSCGTDIITGEQHHERFTVLAAFSEDWL